jgi:hypothetical protein
VGGDLGGGESLGHGGRWCGVFSFVGGGGDR